MRAGWELAGPTGPCEGPRTGEGSGHDLTGESDRVFAGPVDRAAVPVPVVGPRGPLQIGECM